MLGKTQILTKQLVSTANAARDQALTSGYAERLSLEHETAIDMLTAINLSRAAWKASTILASGISRYAAAEALTGLHPISVLGTPYTNAEVARAMAVYALKHEGFELAGEQALHLIADKGLELGVISVAGDVLESSGRETVNYAKSVLSVLESSATELNQQVSGLRDLYRSKCQ